MVLVLLPKEWDFVEYWCEVPDDLPKVRCQGDVFRGLRLARGLSQSETANWFDIYRRTTVYWEAGRCVPSNAHLKLMCMNLSCPYRCLIVPKISLHEKRRLPALKIEHRHVKQ